MTLFSHYNAPKGIHYLRSLADERMEDDVFVDVCTVDVEGHTLSRAVNLGSLRLIRTLLEGGANINSLNRDGQTALIVLCAKKHGPQKPMEMLDYLLSKGADPNIPDRYC